MADVLAAALASAVDVAVSVAFVQMTGLHLLQPALAAARRRGTRIRVLTSTYLDVTEPQALYALVQMGGVTLRVQDGQVGFHTKAHLLVRRDDAVGWVGSSNWSRGGLRDHIERNTRIETPAVFAEAWSHFEALWQRPDLRAPDADFLAEYAAR